MNPGLSTPCLPADEVLASLRADATLGGPPRREAIQLAEHRTARTKSVHTRLFWNVTVRR